VRLVYQFTHLRAVRVHINMNTTLARSIAITMIINLPVLLQRRVL
jgi:hypothetical protein